MRQVKKYDSDYKVQAVKLAEQITPPRAAAELGISVNTIYGWIRATKQGRLDLGSGEQTPEDALTLTGELIQLRKQVKTQAKEIKRLKETNEFLEEASAFFAERRQKLAKQQD